MRTTLDLPEDLLSEAMEVAHAKTKTKVIIMALQELVRKRNIAKLTAYKGKIDLDIDLNTIRDRH
jgi:Arc/MetJ family transcription regulator